MNSDRKADYYVGLDMGTGSLGVAVTDPQYHLLKVKGKDFWFVREYETAHPQLERRTHRISKRRLQRHQVRIGLIRSYFADDVLEHDPLFYIRQDNSKYYREDKKESDLIEFLEKNGYKNPRVIAGKIKKNSLIKYNGYLLYVIGMDARKNIEFSNATPMCLENKYIQYVSKLEKAYNEIILSERKKTEPRLSEKVTIENNLKLYRELTDKHVNSIYRNHPRSIGDILEKGEDKFESLDLVHQIKILYNLVLYTSFNRGTFSLTDIGGPKEVGRIRISGNMTEAKELKLIHYSVTGLYKKEIDLLNQ